MTCINATATGYRARLDVGAQGDENGSAGAEDTPPELDAQAERSVMRSSRPWLLQAPRETFSRNQRWLLPGRCH